MLDMSLPSHAFIAYRYRLCGGLHDGMEQSLPHDVPEISVPAVPQDFILTPTDAQKNMAHHGHAFPCDTKFYRYVATGKVVKGHMVMEFVGYTNNPLSTFNG